MSLLSYQGVRPWAKAIKTAVLSRKMPPSFVDPAYGHFRDDRRLSDADIKTLVTWADGSAPEGDAKDKPEPVKFVDGWGFEPDMIIEMPMDVPLQATGTINYQNILVKVNFPEDRWVVAADLRPGNREAVHHMRANVRPPGSTFMKNAVPGVAYDTADPTMRAGRGPAEEPADLLGKYNPGLGAQDFSLYESAKFVPKGSDIIFNMHYTAIGKETTDRSRLALKFTKVPPKFRYFSNSGPQAFNLVIPAGARNQEIVSELSVVADNVQLAYIQPHMHLRGKDYEIRLISPSGESKTIFKSTWDFNWQLGVDLEEPLPLPKGTRIIGVAHYDNSTENRYNPDPTKVVFWGPQNWDEMQNCFLSFLVDPKIKDPSKLFAETGVAKLPKGAPGPTLDALRATLATN
ncbi:MAG: thiol-disulfide isomerase [Acidobacteria bacterium]|nr:thiol-disulfide isomerase [Acidobacteriota bacterium]